MTRDTANADGASLRVLVADDDPIQRSLISARLSRLNGQTVEAEDGVAAWALLSSQTFDMAIVDLGMPNLDGFGLIQCMRGHPRTRHLPIIVVTSRHDRDAIEQALQAGASSFLVKPIAWSTFEHHVGFLLRMVQSAKIARTAGRKEVAAHRVREAILGTLCGDATATTAWIMDEVEALRRMPLPANAAPLQQQRLNAIFEECKALKMHAEKAANIISSIGDQISVADGKERLECVVKRAVEDVTPPASAKGIKLEVVLPQGDTWLACDADAVRQALRHLLDNAVAHSALAGRVAIIGRIYPDGLLGLEITDHGPGMHPDVVNRSLAPLSVRMNGGAVGGHFGYGLLIAKAIAEAHSGSLELRSMPEQGTTALLVLPPERVTNIAAG
ncbi:MAG: response regulator [Hyphomicrobiaceae bacterium]